MFRIYTVGSDNDNGKLHMITLKNTQYNTARQTLHYQTVFHVWDVEVWSPYEVRLY